MRTQLVIENIKCDGCANTIKKELKLFNGVTDVEVNKEEETVLVEHDKNFSVVAAKEKLLSLGYPEKNSVSGFTKMATNAKSYVSCAIGKMNTQE